jgi:hypothetical protein
LQLVQDVWPARALNVHDLQWSASDRRSGHNFLEPAEIPFSGRRRNTQVHVAGSLMPRGYAENL